MIGFLIVTDCKDMHDACPAWAKSGYCSSNQVVAKECQKSCNPNCKGTTYLSFVHLFLPLITQIAKSCKSFEIPISNHVEGILSIWFTLLLFAINYYKKWIFWSLGKGLLSEIYGNHINICGLIWNAYQLVGFIGFYMVNLLNQIVFSKNT